MTITNRTEKERDKSVQPFTRDALTKGNRVYFLCITSSCPRLCLALPITNRISNIYSNRSRGSEVTPVLTYMSAIHFHIFLTQMTSSLLRNFLNNFTFQLKSRNQLTYFQGRMNSKRIKGRRCCQMQAYV